MNSFLKVDHYTAKKNQYHKLMTNCRNLKPSLDPEQAMLSNILKKKFCRNLRSFVQETYFFSSSEVE